MPMIRAGRLSCLVLGFVLVVGLVSDNSWGLADTSPAESAAEASPPERIAGPRDLLQLYDIDKSHFDRLANGVAWQESEGELLYRILFRLRDFRLMDIESWARPLPNAAQLAGKSEDAWGEFYRLQGRVASVQLCTPLPEVMDRFELKSYYRVEFLLGEDRQPAIVFTQTVPRAWMSGEPIDERAGAIGMFLKLAGDDAQPTPVFVASRVAWYPENLLGDLGMDYGLFDDLKSEEGTGQENPAAKTKPRRDVTAMRLTNRTGECFYQMLAAVCRASPGELLRNAKETLKKEGKRGFSVVPLFNEADKHRGQLVMLSGTVRQVVPVRVSEEDLQVRFGIRQYYQLSLFTDDSQGNPLVFCVPSLPKGMPVPDDGRYAEQVTVAGFLFNTWAYRRESGASEGAVRWQLAPLLLGQEPVWHPRPTRSTNLVASIVFGGVFVLALGGIGVALWLSQRGDKEFRERVFAPSSDADIAASLGKLSQNDAEDRGSQ
jgi:hypothetical protein